MLHKAAPKKTSREDWRPTAIVAALHDAGWTVRKLAEFHGLKNAGSLSRAMRGSSPIGEKRIAEALGLHPKEIGPAAMRRMARANRKASML